jgi:ATP-dependent Lon protease
MKFTKTKFIFACFFLISFCWAPVSFSMSVNDTEAVKKVYKKQIDGAWAELRSTLIKSTFAGASAACMAYFLPIGGATAGAGLTGFAAYYYANDISNAAAYCGLMHKTSNLELAENLNKLEIEFARQEDKLIEYNKKRLNTLIMEARKLIGYGIRPIYVSDRMYPESILQTITEILKFPTTMSKPRDKQLVINELKKHLKTYANSVHDGIIKAANKILLKSKPAESTKLKKGASGSSKAAFIFIGEAGVGKTATAKKIATALGRPFCRLTFADTSREQFYGTASKDRLKGIGGRLGHLARCFTRPEMNEKALDPIIFIDEIHHAFQSSDELLTTLLKDLNDEGIGEIQENSLDIKISIRNTVFILGSNMALPPEYEALASRLTTIYFEDLTKAQKRKIAKRNFPLFCETYDYHPTKNQRKKDAAIIQQIINSDESPGARVLLHVLDDYILHKLTKEDKCIELRCPEFNITESIKNRGGRVGKNEGGL